MANKTKHAEKRGDGRGKRSERKQQANKARRLFDATVGDIDADGWEWFRDMVERHGLGPEGNK